MSWRGWPGRAALLGLGVALAGCARPAPPPTPPPAEPTTAAPPAWLPEGWTESPDPPALPTAEADLVGYAKTGCLAPLLLLASYSPAEAARLAERHGGDAVAWLTALLHDSAAGPGTTVGEEEPWQRIGLVDGRQFKVLGGWPEGRAGVLDGRVAVGRTANGSLVAAVAMIPRGGEPALPHSLLARLPLDLSRPPAVQSQAVGDHAD